MQQLSVADVLSKAADLIERPGAWTQQRDGMPFPGMRECPTCAGFAIQQACGGEDNLDPYFAALFRVIPAYNAATLIRWNDAPDRQQSEVVAALRAAAELAKASS